MTFQARLLLEDGTEFLGRYFTEPKEVFGEIVFNTAMSGYQEVFNRSFIFKSMCFDDVSNDW